jgi:hypothetical protein
MRVANSSICPGRFSGRAAAGRGLPPTVLEAMARSAVQVLEITGVAAFSVRAPIRFRRGDPRDEAGETVRDHTHRILPRAGVAAGVARRPTVRCCRRAMNWNGCLAQSARAWRGQAILDLSADGQRWVGGIVWGAAAGESQPAQRPGAGNDRAGGGMATGRCAWRKFARNRASVRATRPEQSGTGGQSVRFAARRLMISIGGDGRRRGARDEQSAGGNRRAGTTAGLGISGPAAPGAGQSDSRAEQSAEPDHHGTDGLREAFASGDRDVRSSADLD